MDTLFYNSLTITQWNFLKFNLGSDIASFYGTHPWHWYLSQGLPVILTTFLPFTVYGLDSRFTPVLMWFIGLQSLIKHKEFRFLGPILPLCLVAASKSLSSFSQQETPSSSPWKGTWRKKWVWVGLAFTQGALAFYLSRFHQRGVVEVTHYLRRQYALPSSRASLKSKKWDVVFLMPCHSTPYYSHVHWNISMRFLRCDPPWNIQPGQRHTDETRDFYSNPESWITRELGLPFQKSLSSDWDATLSQSLPSQIIAFDVLEVIKTKPVSLYYNEV